MESAAPHIDLRVVGAEDIIALYALDNSFETDNIYTLRMRGGLVRHEQERTESGRASHAFALELVETPVDPAFCKDYLADESVFAEMQERLQGADGGYVALIDGEIVGGMLLHVERWRSVTLITYLVVGRQFRRFGIGSLLLNCAADWARNQKCWAILLETQNVNYPAIQFYLRNGLEIWSIHQHFYPPGPFMHEVAVFMGKKLR